jgi:hypothetical protein
VHGSYDDDDKKGLSKALQVKNIFSKSVYRGCSYCSADPRIGLLLFALLRFEIPHLS